MKLVNCHHVRKRRRRPSGWPKPRSPARDRPAPGGGDNNGEELLKKMTRASPSGDQLHCDQAEVRSNPAGSGTHHELPIGRRPNCGLIATDRRASNNGRNRFKLSNWLLLYSTLVCLMVFDDSADRLASWRAPCGQLGGHTPAVRQRLIPAVSANPDANRLYEDLMMTYNRIVTPTRNASEKLIVRLGLKLSQLMDVVSSAARSGRGEN
jgi:hypothetical protein